MRGKMTGWWLIFIVVVGFGTLLLMEHPFLFALIVIPIIVLLLYAIITK